MKKNLFKNQKARKTIIGDIVWVSGSTNIETKKSTRTVSVSPKIIF